MLMKYITKPRSQCRGSSNLVKSHLKLHYQIIKRVCFTFLTQMRVEHVNAIIRNVHFSFYSLYTLTLSLYLYLFISISLSLSLYLYL